MPLSFRILTEGYAMTAVRAVASVFAFFWLVTVACADDKTYLSEKVEAGQQVQYELGLKLTGQVNVTSGAKTISMDLNAQARHQFDERVLTADEQGHAIRVA